jgi:hypothetical protein
MTVRPLIVLLAGALTCVANPIARAQSGIDELEASYQFLVTPRASGGALYTLTEGALKGVSLPLSFYDSDRYWGAYVCTLREANCAVLDRYDPQDYSLRPRKEGPAATLQAERVNVHNGTNIYDAAMWQIAVMLGATANKFRNSVTADPYEMAAGQTRALASGGDGPSGISSKRATTSGSQFNYGGSEIRDAKKAYAFRMTAAQWLVDDPLRGARYGSWISAANLPANGPEYQTGRVTWSDWKPITGENAWAFLLGPLQAAYLHYVVERMGRHVPFDDANVQSALEMLSTFAALQSQVGGVYYAPSGTVQSDADKSVNPHLVSVENNFSLYAGLEILRATLRAQFASGQLDSTAARRVDDALAIIHAMTSGGNLPNGRKTLGMESFFRNCAWHDGEFVQGGLANDPASAQVWVPVLEPKAVDVNTWGVAALGAERVDGWFGFGSAYRVWKGVKRWGGYGNNRTLWGVGYSDLDGNGQDAVGRYRQGVLSAEWTAGAITMVRNMIKHYHAAPVESTNHALARQIEQELREDERAMLQGVQALRLDRYAVTEFPGKPEHYSELITNRTGPYLYASRRYRIPFGWDANPIPSTAATAWVILIADEYDPFGYAGKPN